MRGLTPDSPLSMTEVGREGSPQRIRARARNRALDCKHFGDSEAHAPGTRAAMEAAVTLREEKSWWGQGRRGKPHKILKASFP